MNNIYDQPEKKNRKVSRNESTNRECITQIGKNDDEIVSAFSGNPVINSK